MAEQSTTTWGLKVLQVRASAWFPVFTSLEHVCSTPKYVYNIIGFDPSRHPKNQKSQWRKKAKRIQKAQPWIWNASRGKPEGMLGSSNTIAAQSHWGHRAGMDPGHVMDYSYILTLLVVFAAFVAVNIYIYQNIYTYKSYNDNICIIPEYI